MAAATYDFEIEQGATLLKPIVWKDSNGTPVNLSGYTARMQIRRSVAAEDVLLELSTANNRINIDALNGTVTLIFDSATTAAFTWTSGVYDLELTSSGGVVTRLIQGKITVSKEVTRG
jgi:hypothetical protein